MVRTWKQAVSETRRVIVRNDSKAYVENRIKEHTRNGYVKVTEILEETDFNFKTYYVCVMEHPERKKKNNPSN